jgi:hypothetical protein
LTGWDFSGQNLSNAVFFSCTLTNADLANSNLSGADLYSATLLSANLTNANMNSASLSYGTLTNANLTNCNLTNAVLDSAILTNTNLTGADLRGAIGLSGTSAITANTILPNGTIQGLQLNTTSSLLVVRNYAPPSYSGTIAIHVEQVMSMIKSSTFDFELDGNSWGSTISFDSGIPVSLGGDLELDLAAGIDPTGLVGETFRLFDWTGVDPLGQFGEVTSNLPAGYSWDTSQLYSTGDVTLVPEPDTLSLLVAALGLAGCVARWRLGVTAKRNR